MRGVAPADRIAALADADSVTRFPPPGASPHLARFGIAAREDDGIVVARARLDGAPVFVVAQDETYLAGSVGERHGAALRAMFEAARAERPQAIVLLLASGGVRLHEANAGLIAISEIMRAVLEVRAAGVPVLALIGGICGAFGGMGIVARMCSRVIMSEEGRLALSGPDVIETVAGVEEFDARDRALVWRVTGGKHRLLTGDCDELVDDDIDAFRAAAARATRSVIEHAPTLPDVRKRHEALARRAQRFAGLRDGADAWRLLGIADPHAISMLTAGEMMALAGATP